MLPQRENSVSLMAGALSIAVHAVLLIGMLISFNWKTTHQVSIAEVELWDSIPNQTQPVPAPIVEKSLQKEIEKEVVKPLEPKIEPVPEPKVDIAIKKKPEEKVVEAKKTVEPKKMNDALEALQKQLRQDELQKEFKQKNDALKKLQQENIAEDKATSDKQASAANAGVVGEFTEKIKAKIRGNVNKMLCGDGNPQLVFEITLLPTGDLQGNPDLIKSSGSATCDDAVERAILQSQPLPLPSDANLRGQFRNLTLKFRPKDE